MPDKKRYKIQKVMHEYKQGTLKSSSGDTVRNRDQAIAIALNSARINKKRKKR